MAVIDQYLQRILEATYGEEVRDSIHDAILQNYMDITESVNRANSAADNANTARDAANIAASNANEKATIANTAASNANEKATLADQKATLADTAAANAGTKAQLADQKATLANTAATNANEKATLADQKATLANTAATNANTARDAANTAATNANEKATLANTAATNANTAKDAADTAATNANEKATLANTAATNANEKAELADTAASNADTKAALANTAATNANEKATLANTAATNANAAKDAADTAAQNANTARDAANTAATNASEKATEADEAAERANEIADTIDAKVSTDSETTSGNPITVETDSAQVAEKTVIHLEPKQDLHGYDHPWPAGGGKNLFLTDADIIKSNPVGNYAWEWNGNVGTKNGLTATINTDSDGNVTSITINGTATANTRMYFYHRAGGFQKDVAYILSGCPVYGSSVTTRIELALYSGSTYYNISYSQTNTENSRTFTIPDDENIDGLSAYIICNNKQTFNNVVYQPMIRLATEADPTYEPYSNICPITGFNAVAVKRVGKNLLPMSLQRLKDSNTESTWNDNVYRTAGVDYTCECDSNDNVVCIKASGTLTRDSQFGISYSKDNIPAGNYYMSTKVVGYTGSRIDTYGWNSSLQERLKKWDGITQSETSMNGSSVEIKMYDDIVARSIIRIRQAIGTVSNIELYPMIRPATDTDDTFEPYTPEQITVQLPSEAGTVYGGELTVNHDGTGELVVDKVKFAINPNDILLHQAALHDGVRYYRAAIPTNGLYKYDDNMGRIDKFGISDTFKRTTNDDTWNMENMSFSVSSNYIYVYLNDTIQAIADMRNYFTQNTSHLCLELISPLTYTLTAEQVTLLKGINNIFTDAESLDLTYRKGTFATLEECDTTEKFLTNLLRYLADEIEEENEHLEDILNSMYILSPEGSEL